VIDVPNDNGFIPLWRSFKDSELWTMGPLAVQLFLYLLFEAEWRSDGSTSPRGYPLERGQLATTVPDLCEALKTKRGRGYTRPPESTVRFTLEKLIAARIVAAIVAGKEHIVTIINYNEWYPLDESIVAAIVAGSVADSVLNSQISSTSKKLESSLVLASESTGSSGVLDNSVGSEQIQTESVEKPKRKKQTLADLKTHFPWTAEIMNKRWHPTPLPASAESDAAKFRILDTLRKLHTIDKLSVEEIGDLIEYVARNWYPKHIGSPASLREWTDKKDRRRWEAAREQMHDRRPQAEEEAEEAETVWTPPPGYEGMLNHLPKTGGKTS
jgi:hypothetical protein